MAVSAAGLPKWQRYFVDFFSWQADILWYNNRITNGEMTMNQFPRMAGLLDDTDTINAILNQLADEGTIEPMIEPIDDPSNMTDFWDWADIVGIVDEFAPLDDTFWLV